MCKILEITRRIRLLKDARGQDLIEYALMAGFVAVASATFVPGITSSVNIIFSKVNSIMIVAASS